MTPADFPIPDHVAPCRPQLAQLRMLAWHEPGEPLPPTLADDICQATSLILAETQASCLASAAAVAGRRRGAAAGFLTPRLARMEAAAELAVRAAKDGDAAALRRHLCTFETLTAAMWTVQRSVTTDAAEPLPGGRQRHLA